MDFTGRLKEAAEKTKKRTICPTHKQHPEFIISQSNQGKSVQWTSCCDEANKLAGENFIKEFDNSLDDMADDMINDIFN